VGDSGFDGVRRRTGEPEAGWLGAPVEASPLLEEVPGSVPRQLHAVGADAGSQFAVGVDLAKGVRDVDEEKAHSALVDFLDVGVQARLG